MISPRIGPTAGDACEQTLGMLVTALLAFEAAKQHLTDTDVGASADARDGDVAEQTVRVHRLLAEEFSTEAVQQRRISSVHSGEGCAIFKSRREHLC